MDGWMLWVDPSFNLLPSIHKDEQRERDMRERQRQRHRQTEAETETETLRTMYVLVETRRHEIYGGLLSK